MLNDYLESQPIAYRISYNIVANNRLSHAYLFETNNYSKKDDFIKAFVKYLMCPSHHLKQDESINCKVCGQIDSNNHIELKIINPDGLWIKKDQLIDLQKTFNSKAIEGNVRVYVINEAEKLNQQAANSILKFLEEPESGIVAILVAENIKNVLSTIRSRCQIISLNNSNQSYKEEYMQNGITAVEIANYFSKGSEDFSTRLTSVAPIIDRALEFINLYEMNKTELMLKTNHFFESNDKKDMIEFFDILTLFYKDMLNVLINRKIEVFIDYEIDIRKYAKNHDVLSVEKEIKNISQIKNQIRKNVNSNLLIDKFLITGGINHD